jgi:transmembrane sensor
VLVRGPTTPGGLLRLSAGDSVTVPSDPLSLTAAAASLPEAIGAEIAPTLEAIPSDELVENTAGESTEGPVVGADEGRVAEGPAEDPAAEDPAVVAAVSPSEAVPEAPPDAESPTELLDRADVLRREGRFDEAASLLSSITLGPPGPEAALAAFTLGRLELERRSHPAEAARAFERAIELGLREPLLEDARARTVEALSRAGDLRATETAAVTYLANYPEGRWCAEVERWSARP